MYIRATKTHSSDGKPAYSYRLVRSERTGDRVRQKTLLNLGTNFSVPKELWRDVAVRVEMSGQLPSFCPLQRLKPRPNRCPAAARGMKPAADTENADDTAHVRLNTRIRSRSGWRGSASRRLMTCVSPAHCRIWGSPHVTRGSPPHCVEDGPPRQRAGNQPLAAPQRSRRIAVP